MNLLIFKLISPDNRRDELTGVGGCFSLCGTGDAFSLKLENDVKAANSLMN